MRRKVPFWGLGFVLASMVIPSLFTAHTNAAVGINQQLNFQGKVVKSDGTNIPDGTYNMEFKVYQDGSGTTGGGGTLKWTEDWLVGGSGGVTVSSGTFDVNLGAHNAFGGSVDWNQDTLWLSFQVGNTSACTISTNFHTDCSGDGEMSPFIRLTAVPYALNSNALGGITASGFVQLSPGSAQSGNINIGSGTIASGLINSQTISSAAVFTGTVNIQGASALTVGSGSNNGAIIFTSSGGSNTVTLQAPTTNPTASYALKLPITAPALGQCLQNDGTTIGQLTFSSCGSGGGLAKNATDTSSAAVTASNYLYGFTNSSSAIASGVLSLTNGTNTNNTLYVTASGNPTSGQALIFASNTNASPSGNLLDLQAGSSPTSKFSVSAAGAVTAATSVTTPLIQSAAATALTITSNAASTWSISSATSGTQLTIAGGTATSGTNVGGNLLLQGGAGASTGASGSVIVKSNGNNSATAFQVQNVSTNQVFGVDTSAGKVLIGSTSVNGTLVVYNSTNSNTITIQSGITSGSGYSLTLPTALPGSTQCLQSTSAGVLSFASCGGGGGNTRTIYLVPEYAGAVLSASGTNNSGTLTSSYDSTNRHNYYSWVNSTATLDNYDIIARTQIPSEYTSGFGTFKIWVLANSTSSSNNDIKVTVRDNSGTACASSVSVLPGSANTWTQQSVTLSGCSFAANDLVTIDVNVNSASSNVVEVGEISYQYTN